MMSPFYPCGSRWLAIFAAAMAPLFLQAQVTGSGTNPTYTAQSIVNGATQTVEALAPNTIATVYGTNLAYSTRAVAATDIVGGLLPTSLNGVGVWVNGIPCSLFYISPTQINFLVPYQLTAGTVTLIVVLDSLAGPGVAIQLNSTSPGLFSWDGNNAVAAHLGGQVISPTSPAVPGEIVVIYANGLGRTTPDATAGKLATEAFPISNASQLQVLFNGVACPPGSVLYAGLAPGFAGLYQINLTLPATVTSNPVIQVVVASQTSPPQVQLAVQVPSVASQ